MQRFHFLDEDGGDRGAHLGMKVHGYVDGVTQSFAHALHMFDRAIEFCIGLDPFVIVIG